MAKSVVLVTISGRDRECAACPQPIEVGETAVKKTAPPRGGKTITTEIDALYYHQRCWK